MVKIEGKLFSVYIYIYSIYNIYNTVNIISILPLPFSIFLQPKNNNKHLLLLLMSLSFPPIIKNHLMCVYVCYWEFFRFSFFTFFFYVALDSFSSQYQSLHIRKEKHSSWGINRFSLFIYSLKIRKVEKINPHPLPIL